MLRRRRPGQRLHGRGPDDHADDSRRDHDGLHAGDDREPTADHGVADDGLAADDDRADRRGGAQSRDRPATTSGRSTARWEMLETPSLRNLEARVATVLRCGFAGVRQLRRRGSQELVALGDAGRAERPGPAVRRRWRTSSWSVEPPYRRAIVTVCEVTNRRQVTPPENSPTGEEIEVAGTGKLVVTRFEEPVRLTDNGWLRYQDPTRGDRVRPGGDDVPARMIRLLAVAVLLVAAVSRSISSERTRSRRRCVRWTTVTVTTTTARRSSRPCAPRGKAGPAVAPTALRAWPLPVAVRAVAPDAPRRPTGPCRRSAGSGNQ